MAALIAAVSACKDESGVTETPPQADGQPAVVPPAPPTPEPPPAPPAPKDSDGDGVPDDKDAFPNDPKEWADADKDGIGDNADPDDDNDGVPDGVDPDADGDKHKSVKYGGDDCDDTNGKVYPGQPDDPDGIDPQVDYNCDGLADADLAKGFLVDDVVGLAKVQGGDGSLAKPFKSLEDAVEAANAGAKTNRGNVYVAVTMTYYKLTKAMEIHPGVGLFGGYQKEKDGVRTREIALAKQLESKTGMSALSLDGNNMSVQPSAEGAFTGKPSEIDGLLISADFGSFVQIKDVSAHIRRSWILGSKTENPLLVRSTKSAISVEVNESLVQALTSVAGKVIALSAAAETTGQLDLNITRSVIVADKGTKGSIGVAVVKLADTAKADLTVIGSTISAGRVSTSGYKSWALALGHDGGFEHSIDRIVVVRNILQGNTAAEAGGAWIARVHKSTEPAIFRNNVFRGANSVTEGHTKGGLFLYHSEAVLLNNTFRDVEWCVVADQVSGLEYSIWNNIFQSVKNGMHIRMLQKPSKMVLVYNLFSYEGSDKPTSYIDMPGTGSVGGNLSDVNAKNQINIFDFTGDKTADAASNVVGQAYVNSNGILTTSVSAAVNKGFDLSYLQVQEAAAGISLDDISLDIQGEKRGAAKDGPWDIGADEWTLWLAPVK